MYPLFAGTGRILTWNRGDDDHFSKIVELTEKNVRADWDWGAEYFMACSN